MKIILSPDSFKGSISARDAADALSRGIRRIILDAECVILPIADGKPVAVIGAFAKTPRYQGSGSSRVNPAFVDDNNCIFR